MNYTNYSLEEYLNTVKGIQKEFHKAVDDYILFCHQVKKNHLKGISNGIYT